MGFLSKLFNSNSSSNSTDAVITVSTSLTSSYVEVKQRTRGKLSAIPLDALGGYVSPSGGYINYGYFQVIGVNPETNRKNKRTYEVCGKDEACECAANDGLTGPYEVKVLPAARPSERQLSFIKELGAFIPNDACSLDASAIISRITDDDEEAVPKKLAKQANAYGVKFSRYHGKKAIMSIAKKNLSVIEYSNFIMSL